MVDTGSCSLIIFGDNLNFDGIEENLGITSTRRHRKGERFSSVSKEFESDVMIFEEKFIAGETLSDAVNRLVDKLISSIDYIKQMIVTSELKLRCYVQSDYAQIYFNFTNDVIEKVSKLPINIEFSVLSWGGVED